MSSNVLLVHSVAASALTYPFLKASVRASGVLSSAEGRIRVPLASYRRHRSRSGFAVQVDLCATDPETGEVALRLGAFCTRG
jgi:hypothetical protein